MPRAHPDPPPEGAPLGGRPRPDGRLESLFREFGPKVYGLALRCGLDPSEAEDGVQEVFLKVQRRLDTFRGESKLSTWLYQVAMNTLLDHRRKLVRQKRMLPFAAVTDERGEVAAEDPGAGPEEQSSTAERKALVRRALDKLPRKFKEVLVLRELEGLSYRDIARILGTAQGTIESRIFRGRARLGEELRRLKEGL